MSKVTPGVGGSKKAAPVPISRAEQRRRNAAFFQLKPSNMINAIVDDLNAAERTKGFVIDMGVWVKKEYADESGNRYSPTYVDDYFPGERKAKLREVCAVCLAGSVMSQRLGVTPGEAELGLEITPTDVGQNARQRVILEAIDSLRCGDIGIFVEAVIGPRKTKALNLGEHLLEYVCLPPYRADAQTRDYGLDAAKAKADRAEFKRDLRRIAKKLAKLGV